MDLPVYLDLALTPYDLGEGEICNGDFYITDAAGLAQIIQCWQITGSLRVQTSNVPHISLPLLESVGTDLHVSLNDAVSIELSSLVSVGGDCKVSDNYSMTTLNLSILKSISLTVTGNVSFLSDPKLADCLVMDLKNRLQSYKAFTMNFLNPSCTCSLNAQGTPVATCP